MDQSLDVQLKQLEDSGCEKIYRETRSGKSVESREDLLRLLEFVREGDVVVVSKLDRLARRLTDMLDIVDRIERKCAALKSLAESVIDTSSPAGRLVFQVFAVVAEFERERLRERTLEGLERAKANGSQLGRKFSLTKEQVEHVRKLNADGASYQDLAASFGVSKTSIYRYCKST